jgi:hypothetical protein
MKTNKITIIGGGSAGWMTASTLIKSFPDKCITVVESDNVPIVGVGESTLSSIRQWTRLIDLDEHDFFAHTDASYKLSIKFTDFYKKDYGFFFYPFGIPYNEFDRNPFIDWHIKKYFFPETDTKDFVNCLFPSSYLFENNKFSLNHDKKLDHYNPATDLAYHFDAIKFGNWLKERYCKPKGVKHIIGTVNKILLNDSGIEKIVLENGLEIKSDLYIDCTGFKSLLLGETLSEPFLSYSDMLPNNKAWATRIPYKNKNQELESFTNCTAISNGWCWNIPLWSRLGTGYVYSDKFIDKEKALEEFKNYLMSNKMVVPRTFNDVESFDYKDISMRVGIHEKTFVKNVVAIGLSAGFIEPLESNGLFSVHEFLFKLVDILQRNEISQWDRDMYNVSVKDLFDRFAKFVSLHYALSHRTDSEYWRSLNSKSFTDRYNDPYNQCVIRTDNFYDLIDRYMEKWCHPIDRTGIPYISTGMQLFMMNKKRISEIEFNQKVDLSKDIQQMINKWENKKTQWKEAADQSPSLMDFLQINFYNKK